MISSRMASGIDNFYLDFLKSRTESWKLACESVHTNPSNPTLWKKARIGAALKPNKPATETQSYRSISLFSCCIKLFERCLIGHKGEIIGAEIPHEQRRYRKDRNCCQQVLEPQRTSNFWHCSETYNIKVEMNGKTSRTRILNNGMRKAQCCRAFFTTFTQATCHQPSRESLCTRMILQWPVGRSLSKKLRERKSCHVSFVFHLNDRQANRQLILRFDSGDVVNEKFPKYPGIYLDANVQA